MANFPTLSVKPDASGWKEGPAIDPTLRNNFENGAMLSRPRFTNVPKKWEITYTELTDADKALLEAFQVTTNWGGDTFTWTNPKDSTAYTVRFGGPLEFSLESEFLSEWKTRITLIQSL